MAGAARERQGYALGVRTEAQSSQIRFPPMLIADGASISGASPKMLPRHRTRQRRKTGVRKRAYGRN